VRLREGRGKVLVPDSPAPMSTEACYW
jgi:hypothetical protein